MLRAGHMVAVTGDASTTRQPPVLLTEAAPMALSSVSVIGDGYVLT